MMAKAVSSDTMVALTFFCVCLLLLSVEGVRVTSDDDYEAVEVGAEPEVSTRFPWDPRVICKLPAKRGNCRALLLRWRYDPIEKRCVEFKYGGCSGNANNFPTKKICSTICEDI